MGIADEVKRLEERNAELVGALRVIAGGLSDMLVAVNQTIGEAAPKVKRTRKPKDAPADAGTVAQEPPQKRTRKPRTPKAAASPGDGKRPCPVCRGTGKRADGSTCPSCAGTGWLAVE